MKFKFIKSVSVMVSAMSLAGVIAGCGVKSENTSQTENNVTKQESETENKSPDMKPGGGRGEGGLVKKDTVDTSAITNKYLDVAYANTSESQKLDIYLPDNIKESEAVPVIVYVHGGAFKTGDKSGGVLGSVLEGVKKGYAVVSINYRMSGEATFPAAIEDAKAAIRYLRANASEYNLDTENFAIWGESAGGNIAAMVGTTGDDKTFDNADLGNAEQSSAVQAVVDWFGPLQFTEMDNQFKALGLTPKMGATSSSTSPESQYIGEDISKNPQAAEKANPGNYISASDPAFLIQHGTADTNVPLTQSQNFAKALEQVLGSSKVTLETFEGAGHGDFGGVKAFETEDNVKRVFEFLDSQLKNS